MKIDLEDINELIELANRLSTENDKPYLIFDGRDDIMVSELTKSVDEIRDSKIDLIIGNKYYVDSYEVLISTLPSRSIHYETVTSEICPIKRHKRISDMLHGLGFETFSLHRMPNIYETSYINDIIMGKVIIRVYPNLITNVSVMDSEFRKYNYRFFFNMGDIMKIIQNNTTKDYYRDLKIKNILL